MLAEGPKIDLLHGERRKAAKAHKNLRRKELLKHGAGQVVNYLAMRKAERIKDWMIMRDLAKRDRKKQMDEAKVRSTGGFGSEKVKPWLSKKSPKFKAALEKHGPSIQKHADKWGGKASMVGHAVHKFSKSNPKTMSALKWGGAIGGAAVAKAGADVIGHYIAHKAKMRDPNYAYQTRRRYDQQRGTEVQESMARFPHTSNAMKKVNQRQAAWVSVTRSMATDKIGVAGKALMNNKKYQLPRRTNTGTKTESVSDTIIMRAGDIHEAIPLVGAAVGAVGKLAASTLGRAAVKSAVTGAASSIGSSIASKAMAPKKRKAEEIEETVKSVVQRVMRSKDNSGFKRKALVRKFGAIGAEKYIARVKAAQGKPLKLMKAVRGEEIEEAWGTMLKGLGTAVRATAGSIAGGAKKTAAAKGGRGIKINLANKDTRSHAHKAWDKFKSTDAGKKVATWAGSKSGKKVLQKGAEGVAGGIGTAIGRRIGRRIEHGSKRQQIKRARFERKLSRIRGSNRSRYEGVDESAVGAAIKYSPVGLAAKMTKKDIKKFRGVEGVDEGSDPPFPPLSKKTIQAVKTRRARLIADKPKVPKGYYGSPEHQKALQKLTGKKTNEGVDESSVSPSARSQFEINPIKQTKDYLHMQRNAYIERKSRISRKAKQQTVSKLAKPDETQNESLNEMKASKVAKMVGKDVWKKAKKHPGKVVAGAGALAAYGAWKKRRTHRKYQEKMAAHHEKHYDRHVANIDYMDDVKAAKQRRREAFR